MSQPTSIYVHGTTGGEQRRLTRLNELMNDACLRELNLRGGERVLDVGSGLAQFTRQMAKAVGPQGVVIGVERDDRQREEALSQARVAGEERLVQLRAGDATALPLQESEWASFDVVHTRFLLEHVPNPLAVVRGMVKAARPGGRVVLADDDHDVIRLWPEPPGFGPLWQAYVRTYDRLGNDPYVGRRLVSLLHQAGARPTRNTWIFFGSCAGNPTFAAFVANLIGVIDGAREAILSPGISDAYEFDEGVAAIRAWGRRPDAAIWYPVCWAEGIRPVERG